MELAKACASGDRNAQRRLYSVLMPYLNAVCQRYLHDRAEAQDVLQETFISIFKNINQFDAERSAFRTWATRIAINFCLKNNAKRQRAPQIDEFSELHDTPIAPEILQKLSNEDLLDWLKTMPWAFAQVFNLHAIDGFSHEEIAQILGIEPALSRQRLSRAREWLRKNCPPSLLHLSNLHLN